MIRRRAAYALALAGFLASCQSDLTEPRALPELDRAFFDCRVQPVLTKYCSALACHGDERRFFTVFARNRLRLDADEAERNAFMQGGERAFNYESTRAFVTAGSPDDSLLTQKPLEQSAGGFFHRGATLFGGGDVFATRDDPDYRVLVDWIEGATEDPTCEEPGSNL